jgi:hypothetical protein
MIGLKFKGNIFKSDNSKQKEKNNEKTSVKISYSSIVKTSECKKSREINNVIKQNNLKKSLNYLGYKEEPIKLCKEVILYIINNYLWQDHGFNLVFWTEEYYTINKKSLIKHVGDSYTEHMKIDENMIDEIKDNRYKYIADGCYVCGLLKEKCKELYQCIRIRMSCAMGYYTIMLCSKKCLNVNFVKKIKFYEICLISYNFGRNLDQIKQRIIYI